MRWPFGRAWTLRLTVVARVAAIGVAIFALAGFLAWEVPRISPITYRQTDLLPIYLGLHSLGAGQDPYSLAVGAEAYRQTTGQSAGLTTDRAAQFGFHYPLPPALLYLPFSLFASLETATLLLRTLTVACYLLALFCLMQRYAAGSSPLTKALMLLWGLSWWPFLVIILPMVQPSGLAFAAMVFCLLAAASKRWFWAGFACFFALLKPQDALPLLVVLAVYAALRAEVRWRLLAGFAVAGAVPTAIAFLWRPDWLGAWVSSVIELPPHIPDYYQNPPATLAAMLGPLGGVVWVTVGALVLGWLALLVWTCRAGDPQWAMAMGCALAVALAPRTGIWEMVIGLLPWLFAWHWAGEIEQKRWRRGAQALLWILWLAVGLMSYVGYGVLSNVAFGLGLAFALVALPHFRASVLPVTFALAKSPSKGPGTFVNALAQGKDGNAGEPHDR